jgi:dTDP-4-amino-4,6-dideoxygalactose transaminase
MGFNYRNNEMADALCRSFLKRYDSLQDLRSTNCEYLNRELGKIKGVKPLPIPDGYKTSYHLYKVSLYPEILGITTVHPKRFRWAIQKALSEEGVKVFEWHNMPVPAQKIFLNRDAYGKGAPWSSNYCSEAVRKMTYDPNDYPKTVDMFDRSFCIDAIYPPNNLELMQYIVEAFKKVFGHLDEIVDYSKTITFPTMPGEKRII